MGVVSTRVWFCERLSLLPSARRKCDVAPFVIGLWQMVRQIRIRRILLFKFEFRSSRTSNGKVPCATKQDMGGGFCRLCLCFLLVFALVWFCYLFKSFCTFTSCLLICLHFSRIVLIRCFAQLLHTRALSLSYSLVHSFILSIIIALSFLKTVLWYKPHSVCCRLDNT